MGHGDVTVVLSKALTMPLDNDRMIRSEVCGTSRDELGDLLNHLLCDVELILGVSFAA